MWHRGYVGLFLLEQYTCSSHNDNFQIVCRAQRSLSMDRLSFYSGKIFDWAHWLTNPNSFGPLDRMSGVLIPGSPWSIPVPLYALCDSHLFETDQTITLVM